MPINFAGEIASVPSAPQQECFSDDTLVDLVEGRLAPGDAPRVEAHLDTCESCRAFLADLLAVSGTDRPPTSPLLAPGTQVGRYLITERIGAGGMGLVYAALDPLLERHVAIKVVRSGGQPSRLLDEARVMARLQSPHTVSVFDVGTIGSSVFIAMELVEGVTLRAYCKGRSWAEILLAFRRAGKGLAMAHAAGLVHGDFKPDNVLVRSRDKRVLVADFGLAHPSSDPHLRCGTLAYMAPEQLAGQRGDARSDQFAFSVSLWECLFGQRPFSGESFEELRAAMQRRERLAPMGTPVPAWVRKRLERGLALRPEDRYPSMDSLVAALGRDPAQSLRRVGGLAVWALCGVVLGAVLWPRTKTLCRLDGHELDGAWDTERRTAVHQALLQAGGAFSAANGDAVIAILDRWAASWRAMRRDACEATHQRGEQSPALLDRRMRCLDDRKLELQALTELLLLRDAESARRAVPAAEDLTEVSHCGPKQVGEQRPPPDSRRADVAAAAMKLRQMHAQASAGKWALVAKQIEAFSDTVSGLGYRPLWVEAELLAGRAYNKVGNAAGAAQALDGAAAGAEAERMDLIAAEAWSELIYVLGHRLQDEARAVAAARHAEAAVERAGGSPRLRARIERQLGVTAATAGREAEAVQHFRRALQILKDGGLDGLELAALHTDLGTALAAQRALPAALSEHRLALSLQERQLGREHPALTAPLVNLANVLNSLGRAAESVPLFERALAIEERSGQGDSPNAALVMENLALALTEDATRPRAELLLRRAIAVSTARLGADSAQTAGAMLNLAGQLQEDGRCTEAAQLFHQVLLAYEKRLRSDHPALAPALNGLGQCLLASGKPQAALEHFQRALRIRAAALEPEDPRLAYSYEGMGESLLALGRPRAAAAALLRALALLEKEGTDTAAITGTRRQLRRANAALLARSPQPGRGS